MAWSLAERGLVLELVPLEKGVLRRLWQLRDTRRADGVILQRKLLPRWQLAVLGRYARRLIFDLDDAIYQRDSYAPKQPESRVRLGRFRATVGTADAVITGNDYLRQRVLEYTSSDRVHVVPTCVEPRFYPTAEHRRRGSAVRMVWIGQRSTLPSLESITRQMVAAETMPNVELRVISDEFPTVDGIRCVPRRWAQATETAELADCDIGVSWLPDDDWSRGKCGLKVMQYMAAGLPVVANPVGVHRQMVVQGSTGFLATTPGEWYRAVEQLAADPSLRARMGAAGRRFVEEHYSLAGWAPRLADLIASVVGGRSHGEENEGMVQKGVRHRCAKHPAGRSGNGA